MSLIKLFNIAREACQPNVRINRIESLKNLQSIVSTLSPKDFDISKHNITWRIPLYIPVILTPHFDIALFTIPAGKRLPLHNHPEMTVISKFLDGSVRYRAFDWLSNISSMPLSRRRKAILTTDCTMNATSEPIIVEPNKGNVHDITALNNTILLDILSPPYSVGIRDCTYFKEKNIENNIYFLEPIFPEDYECGQIAYEGPGI